MKYAQSSKRYRAEDVTRADIPEAPQRPCSYSPEANRLANAFGLFQLV